MTIKELAIEAALSCNLDKSNTNIDVRVEVKETGTYDIDSIRYCEVRDIYIICTV